MSAAAWQEQLAEARNRLRHRFNAAESAVNDDLDDSAPTVASSSTERRFSAASSVLSEDEVSRFLLHKDEDSHAAPIERDDLSDTSPVRDAESDETPSRAVPPSGEDERTCRICFCGPEEEPELGRLFSPCRCSGTSRYVHTRCLDQWRKASVGQSFYRCDQCLYQYKLKNRFMLGKVLQSQAALLALTFVLFVVLLWAAGFLANWIIAGVEKRAARLADSPWEDLFVSDYQIVGENLKEAVTFFEKKVAKQIDVRQRSSEAAASRSGRMATEATEMAQKTAVHFAKGLSLVGLTSFFQTFIATAFVGPFGLRGSIFRAFRPRRRQGNDQVTTMQLVIVTFVIFGSAKAIMQVYIAVKWLSRKVLLRLETLVLEV